MDFPDKNITSVHVKVVPRSHKTELLDIMTDGTYKISVRAIPENHEANRELVRFLEKNLSGKWRILAGATNTRKILKKEK